MRWFGQQVFEDRGKEKHREEVGLTDSRCYKDVTVERNEREGERRL